MPADPSDIFWLTSVKDPSQGKAGMIDATNEDVRNEVSRCMKEYGHEGGFILLPMLISEEGNSVVTGTDPRLPAFTDEWNRHRML